MKYPTMGFAALFIMLLAVSDANAVACARGVARAGCATTARRLAVVAPRRPVLVAPRPRCDWGRWQASVPVEHIA